MFLFCLLPEWTEYTHSIRSYEMSLVVWSSYPGNDFMDRMGILHNWALNGLDLQDTQTSKALQEYKLMDTVWVQIRADGKPMIAWPNIVE